MVEFEPVALDENTEIKVPMGSSMDNVTVNVCNNNVCQEDEDDEQYVVEYNRLSSLYRQLPADVFVQNLLRDYISNEDKLDATRHLFFDALRENEDFPFGLNSELKRQRDEWLQEKAKLVSHGYPHPIVSP